MEIAPGIHRLGGGLVNVYLLEEAGAITVIDAGFPGYWRLLPGELAAMGRSLQDVKAVVLTHAHVDHIGFAERIRSERAVPIRVHRDDATMARGETKAVGQSVRPLRLLPTVRFLLYGMRNGLRSTAIKEVTTFDDGATLDVPGSPRAIHVPGHSPGSAAFHASGASALFVGDALATLNVMTGIPGPQIAAFSSDISQARASLARLEDVEARFVLPGHGTPWTGGVPEALRLARQGPLGGTAG